MGSGAERATRLGRKTFTELPAGWKPLDAISQLHVNDVMILQKQAYDQAQGFEVLRVEDVIVLSQVKLPRPCVSN